MKTKLTLIIIALLIPFIAWAQFDFNLDDFLFDDFDINSDITINEFDLIWSTDTYIPYEYQGRALPSPGSKVIVGAIVSVSNGEAGSLKYSWFLEDIFQRNKSGYGMDSFYFYVNQSPGAYQTVRLQIFNEERSVFKEKSIKIPVVEPELVIYPSNGTAYFSDRTSKISLVLVGKEFSFIARPYFFSIKKTTDLTFKWHLAGQEPIISSNYDANILGLTISKKEDKEVVESDLWVSVSNKKESRQKASQILRIKIY